MKMLSLIFFLSALLPFGLPLEYVPSRIYTYKYDTEVAFNEADVTKTTQAKGDVGFKFTSDVILTPVWNSNNKMLVKLQLSSTKIKSQTDENKNQNVKTVMRYPLFFHWEGSNLMSVYISEKDPSWSANMKIGIASLLQIQRDNGHRHEVDVSGSCTATYNVEGDKITKTKTDCKNVNTAGQYVNVNPVLDVDLKSVSETIYLIKEDIIQSVSAMETHVSKANIQDTLTMAVASKQHLELGEVISGASKVQASTLEEAVQVISVREKLSLFKSNAVTIFDAKQCSSDECSSIEKTVEQYREAISSSNMATSEAGSAYLMLLNTFRHASKESILAALRDYNNGDIVPQLIDVIVGAQTTAGQEALLEYIDFMDTYDITLPERYLLAAAFSTHPSENLLQDLKGLFEKDLPDDRVRESVGEALGATVYTYCKQDPKQCDSKLVSDIQKTILDKLEKCEDATCKLIHIRALTNAALPETLPILLDYALMAKESSINEAAIKAFRRFDKELVSQNVRDVVKRVFHQQSGRGYDTAVRTQALKILLDTNPSEQEVLDILQETTDPDQTEMDMYVQARLFLTAQVNASFSDKLRKALSDTKLSNYHILAPKGKSLAFKEHLAETPSMAATYDMFVENSKASIMKRSGMEVDVINQKQNLQLYSFGIFAAGLEGLLGEEVEAGQEDVEPTAGLALNLIEVSLRPVTFFVGQSGLMSAVWNAPSDLVSALQANILLHDNSLRIPLQNGLVVNHDVQGVVSMDLSGLVSISLWNKNCHTLIKNSGALVVHGSLGIETAAFRSGVTYQAHAASLIDFITDVDFSDKIKMCLQMSRPAFTYRHNVSKYESAAGFKKGYVAKIRRSKNVNGSSYPLPKPNNEQCRVLLANS